MSLWNIENNREVIATQVLNLLLGSKNLEVSLGLLGNEGLDGLLVPLTLVVDRFAVDEKLQSGIATHIVFLRELLVDRRVDFGNFDFRACHVVLGCQLLIIRSHFFAMSTPRGIELHKDKFLIVDKVVGCFVGENVNILFECSIRAQRSHQQY